MEVKEHEGKALRYIVLEPEGYDRYRPYPLVILLHGFGSNMSDLVGLGPAIGERDFLYAFPNAPIEFSVGPGAVGYAWAAPPDASREQSTEEAQGKLDAFFEEVVDRYEVELGRVVLGGFSQGGMMTYNWGLPNPQLFHGLAVLSGKLPDPDALQARLPPGRDQAVFIAHGTLDTMIPVEEGRLSRRSLEAHGYAPKYHEHEMAHEITQEVVAELARWIHDVLRRADGPD